MKNRFLLLLIITGALAIFGGQCGSSTPPETMATTLCQNIVRGLGQFNSASSVDTYANKCSASEPFRPLIELGDKTEAACAADTVLYQQYLGLLKNGGVKIDSKKLADCVAQGKALRNQFKMGKLGSDYNAAVKEAATTGACSGLLVPQRKSGQPCEFSVECEGTLICDRSSEAGADVTKLVCTQGKAKKDLCLSDQECAKGLKCEKKDLFTAWCQEGAKYVLDLYKERPANTTTCQLKDTAGRSIYPKCQETCSQCARDIGGADLTCKAFSGAGQPCGDSVKNEVQCQRGFSCENNVCVADTLPENANCAAGSVGNCAEGLYCTGDILNGPATCKKPGQEGANCAFELSDSRPCARGLDCFEGKCSSYKVGDRCDDYDRCGVSGLDALSQFQPFVCYGADPDNDKIGKCTKIGATGASCTEGTDCAFGNDCLGPDGNKKCVAKKKAGESCADDSECLSFACSGTPLRCEARREDIPGISRASEEIALSVMLGAM